MALAGSTAKVTGRVGVPPAVGGILPPKLPACIGQDALCGRRDAYPTNPVFPALEDKISNFRSFL